VEVGVTVPVSLGETEGVMVGVTVSVWLCVEVGVIVPVTLCVTDGDSVGVTVSVWD
jgi:hypothetical protein